ncbi:hypothetical protein [Mycolicibacterium wolinskyi]|uniref:hypothetical protein n=1 Tax=Mycolicibacterium wolinskyi TaxID=59750 RepID=UPI00391774E2
MRSSNLCGRGLAVLGVALGIGIAVGPTASADPDAVVQTEAGAVAPAPAAPAAPVAVPDPTAPAPDPMAAGPVSAGDASPAAVAACSLFAEALDNASVFYGDFADTIDGSTRPDYSDPIVNTTNVSGRTALRESAAKAMNAAGTPGLSPDIASPMRAWSVDATKLLLKMGLRGSGDTLNVTASELNDDAHNAQMACALAGTHA